MFEQIKEKYFEEITKIRRDLHQITEEGLKDFETS